MVIDEVGDCRPNLWSTVCLPTLVDRKGWALFIGTPKGKNFFYDIYQRSQQEDGWYSLTLKASESGILDESELLEMKAQMEPEEFAQEMECDFTAAVKGTYYADLIQKMELSERISTRAALYDSSLTVKVAADLGRTDNCAWWFWQETPMGINVIDYEENQGKHLDFYIEMLEGKGYKYEEVWLPHDAVAKTLSTKRSTIEQMLEAGFPCRLVPRLSVQHGIDAVRKVLPNFRLNQEKCFAGIEALRAYKRQYSPTLKQFSDTPLHDWASDGSDAMRYMSLVCLEIIDNQPIRQKPLVNDENHYNFSIDDLFKEREERKRNLHIRIER
jgi:phage terminase large subunit